MPDVFTRAKRSEVMSRIRSHGNKDTERALIRLFRALRITGWRRQVSLPLETRRAAARPRSLARGRVKPDFVFPRLRLAVFVDCCFWHGCPKHATQPRGNAAYWRAKFAANKARDRLVTTSLRRNGWRVLRIWEHEFTRRSQPRLVKRLRKFLEPPRDG